ncbi:hypothetical protein M427DRAFT_34465 [Gonapodya prolifera JEL478]|uniref:Uncharacterized protein n=1 Tax=Gonapodya prolifera (strain JEL478) TaxID=1344416 RepID=A0A139A8W8_GONPJ|nr:hypothetical protein M427DRAFT_34465 [Gonapodya prolifera JEL478]|eukprot:KXS12843.1 hypothetical protein M427DRAFT_34465 [Gonapodya prolifera JEL478]
MRFNLSSFDEKCQGGAMLTGVAVVSCVEARESRGWVLKRGHVILLPPPNILPLDLSSSPLVAFADRHHLVLPSLAHRQVFLLRGVGRLGAGIRRGGPGWCGGGWRECGWRGGGRRVSVGGSGAELEWGRCQTGYGKPTASNPSSSRTKVHCSVQGHATSNTPQQTKNTRVYAHSPGGTSRNPSPERDAAGADYNTPAVHRN